MNEIPGYTLAEAAQALTKAFSALSRRLNRISCAMRGYHIVDARTKDCKVCDLSFEVKEPGKMKCPVCETDGAKVADVRAKWNTPGFTRRRRKCDECGYKFNTFEVESTTLSELFEKHIGDEQILAAINNVLDKELPIYDRGRPKKRSKQSC